MIVQTLKMCTNETGPEQVWYCLKQHRYGKLLNIISLTCHEGGSCLDANITKEVQLIKL